MGPLAIIVTRPIPLLAETMAIIAGTSRLGCRLVLVAVIAGAIPAALLHAVACALASGFASGAVVFVVVLLMASLFQARGQRCWETDRYPKTTAGHG